MNRYEQITSASKEELARFLVRLSEMRGSSTFAAISQSV